MSHPDIPLWIQQASINPDIAKDARKIGFTNTARAIELGASFINQGKEPRTPLFKQLVQLAHQAMDCVLPQ